MISIVLLCRSCYNWILTIGRSWPDLQSILYINSLIYPIILLYDRDLIWRIILFSTLVVILEYNLFLLYVGFSWYLALFYYDMYFSLRIWFSFIYPKSSSCILFKPYKPQGYNMMSICFFILSQLINTIVSVSMCFSYRI